MTTLSSWDLNLKEEINFIVIFQGVFLIFRGILKDNCKNCIVYCAVTQHTICRNKFRNYINLIFRILNDSICLNYVLGILLGKYFDIMKHQISILCIFLVYIYLLSAGQKSIQRLHQTKEILMNIFI